MISLRYLLLAVFSLALLFTATKTADACTCGPRPTVLESFEQSDEVVILRAVAVEKVEQNDDTEDEFYVDGVRSATLVVEKAFKGKLKVRDEIVFGQGNGADCIWTFNEKSVGQQFLFYLTRPEKLAGDRYLPSRKPGLWFTSFCGRSRGLAAATEDLLYLENIAKARGKTRISGVIGGGFAYPDIDVDEKKVKIIGPKKTYETKTDKNGVFEIYDLPPGKYFVEPETPAGWKIDPYYLRYSQSVVINEETGRPEMKSPRQVAVMLEAKKHASIYIAFTVENSVRGRVLDPKGRAMRGVCVYMLRPGQDAWGPSDCTDEQGQFEITQIPEGEYVLVANQDGKLSSREPFSKIFYPNVMERERAAVINISPGERLTNLDIVIPKLEETVTITGILQYSDGKPVVEEWVKFKVSKADEKLDGDVSEKTDGAGRFTLTVLKGLTGELSAEEWLMKGIYKNCPKVDELIAKSEQNSVTVFSNIIKLTTEQDVFSAELTLPFPRCEKIKE
jgi:hypothetical protein